MKAYLVAAPVRVQSVVQGVLFGVFFGAFTWLGNGGSWAASLFAAVIGGVFFGYFMGRIAKRNLGDTRSELENLSLQQRRAALRAATRGPAPRDPAVREAALHCAERSTAQLERRKRSNIIFFAVALAAYAVMALTLSPWWWLAFVMFAGFLGMQLAYPRRLQNRVEILSTKADTAA